MSDREVLDRLCELHGITTAYDDVWGKHHEVPEASKQALLAAMGVEAADAANAARQLQAEKRRQWQRTLPPALVVSDDDALQITVTLATDQASHACKWRLQHEDGTHSQGEFAPAELRHAHEHIIDGQRYRRYLLGLPIRPPLGYHELTLTGAGLGEPARMRLIVAPARCYQPPALAEGARVWGLGVQLYGVRSQRNWGMGDFTDLRALVDVGAELGADIIGVNPLHALFAHKPAQASPYSPSSRLYLNLLYIDIEDVADYGECEEARRGVGDAEFQAALRALRAADLVDYPAVAERKLKILELLFRHFREHHLVARSARGRAFLAYRHEQGHALRSYALFEALQEHFQAEDAKVWGWPVWPEEYRDPASPAVAALAAEKQVRCEFFEYTQWLADLQLDAIGQRSWERDLRVGLYTDLAVGVDAGGAETWANQSLYALAARIGAPPDEYNLKGQDWGLPPLIPQRLIDAAYAPFIATLRHNMRHAGALRIDHVMGLMRLFWVPPGRPPEEGAYVMYPYRDLLAILALESQRNQCMVIGEDLGTVPDEIRAALQPLGVLSYRLFYFERSPDGSFLPPAQFPPQALVAITTHDLPPLYGYWAGVDIERRVELELFPSEAARSQQIVARAQERAQLLLALEREQLLPAGLRPDPVAVPKMTDELMVALHTYLARSAAELMLVQPEDIFGQCEQANLPGTVDQHPNWRRKLALNIDAWRDDRRIQALTQVLRAERGVRPRADEAAATASAGHPAQALPSSTYRLQFNRDFTFVMATELIPYLNALGVSHCYASPYLKARPGSPHGYDIIDHNALNPEIGSPEDFERFVAALHRHDMSHILDMVPNHMGIMGSDNMWWLDVLENGQASVYADYFDIDWEAMRGPYRHKVLLPVLGDHYGVVLERGELQIKFDREGGAFSIWYFSHRFPIDPKEYPQILGYRGERLAQRLGAEHAELREFESLIAAFRNLPARTEIDGDKLVERRRDKDLHKNSLAALCRRNADIALFIDENVAAHNGTAGEPTSFQPLHQLIQAQAYRLSYWRVASDEINYRRFFDINDLAALRMENPQVFEQTHRLTRELLVSGKIGGLRIDHPDGMYDPKQYFERLQTLATPSDDTGLCRLPYLVIEKILAHYERLPDSWPVHGTTGYEFVNLLNGVFVDGGAEARMTRIYSGFIHQHIDFNELLYDTKKLIMRVALASELGVLAGQLSRIAQADTRICDFTQNGLRDALAEIVACFPVYRTYITAAGASAEDTRYVDWAVSVAKRRSQAADVSIFDFVRDVLLIVAAEGKPEDYRRAVTAFAMKFQQYTSPLMAKGLEDTSFYIYNRLVSLNEVGGDPRRFGTSLTDFHRANQERLQAHPHTLLATSTHDNKRSEDVRARIDVLSEIPDTWQKHLSRWARLNRGKKRVVDDAPAPSRNDEYLLYQTVLGAWPLLAMDEAALNDFCARIEAYMTKAIREAKVHTSWINPNAAYEEAMTQFIRALLNPSARNPFLTDFLPLVQRVSYFGLCNSLSQTLLKHTVPGVPDLYQGNEVWDFSLVDPDNRRPVDYPARRAMLDELKAWYGDEGQRARRVRALVDDINDGRTKLLLTWRLLTLRRERPELFQRGNYLPLTVSGEHGAHLCAFARTHGDTNLIVLAPRLFARLLGEEVRPPLGAAVWEDARAELPAPLAAAHYVDLITGSPVDVNVGAENGALMAASALANFPVAALISV